MSIGFAYAEDKPIIFLLGSLSALFFWFLEARWNFYKQLMIDRATDLENFLRNNKIKSAEYDGPAISKTFEEGFASRDRKKRMRRYFFFRHVYVPHIFVVIGGVIIFLFEEKYISILYSWLISIRSYVCDFSLGNS
ncbi:MAG: hypothetical protein R3C97_00295 [Geminicoccaceae bacterium]